MDLRNMLPTKRFFTPTIILILLFSITILVPQYKVYILAVLLPFVLVKLVIDVIKIKKEDKVNKTMNLFFAIFNIIVVIAIMLALYFGSKK